MADNFTRDGASTSASASLMDRMAGMVTGDGQDKLVLALLVLMICVGLGIIGWAVIAEIRDSRRQRRDRPKKSPVLRG